MNKVGKPQGPQGQSLKNLFPRHVVRHTKVKSSLGREHSFYVIKFLDNNREYGFFNYPFVIRNEAKSRNEATPPHRLMIQIRTRKTDGSKFAFVNNINLAIGGVTKEQLFEILNSTNDWAEYKGNWIPGEYLTDCSGVDIVPPIMFAQGEFTPWDAHKIALLFYSPFVCTLDEARRREGLNRILAPARKLIHDKHSELRLKKKANLNQLVNQNADTFGLPDLMMSPLRYSEYIMVKKGYLRNPKRPTQSLAKYVELSNEVVSAFNWDALKAGLTIDFQLPVLVKFLQENKLETQTNSYVLPASTYTASLQNVIKKPQSDLKTHSVEERQPLNTSCAKPEVIGLLAEHNKVAEAFLCDLADAYPAEFNTLAQGLVEMNVRGQQLEIAHELLKGDVKSLAHAITSRSEDFVDRLNDICAERKIPLAASVATA